jgi:hypothetical protein
MIAKPTPRTRQTAVIAARLVAAGSASAGAPSSSSPTARVVRYPNLAIRRGVSSSAATVDSISAPVVKPAPVRPAPTEAAYTGTTESSR